MKSSVRIVHNRLLGGWFIVRGSHQTPISGRFDSRADAQMYMLNAHRDIRAEHLAKAKKGGQS